MICLNNCKRKPIYSPAFEKYFCGGCGSELKEVTNNESRK
jgi:transcription initiation factor IIE alpha subunit